MKRLKCHYLPGRLRDPLLARHHRSMLVLILLQLASHLASVFAKGSLADPSVVVPRWKHHTKSNHQHGMMNTNLKGDISGLYSW